MSLQAELPESRIDALQERIGYRFLEPNLLRQAFVHGSWLNEVGDASLESNERLEFLGDAILGAVVGRELFERYPATTEGWLTISRARLVQNRTLARVAAPLDLGSYLLMGAGVANEGARARPRVLSRTLEAVFGAVWLDGGDAAVRDVILRLLESEFDAISETAVLRDAKSRLQHMIQVRRGVIPKYEIVAQSGPAHERHFTARVLVDEEEVGTGEGSSKRHAEMAAAAQALDALGDHGEPPDDP